MYYILRLPSHDFVAHVLDSRSKGCYTRDEKFIYLSLPDTNEDEYEDYIDVFNGLMDLTGIGLCKRNGKNHAREFLEVPEA